MSLQQFYIFELTHKYIYIMFFYCFAYVLFVGPHLNLLSEIVADVTWSPYRIPGIESGLVTCK